MVFQDTDTALSMAPERVTVKVMASPSEALALAMENDGRVSSFSIVPVALPALGAMLTPVPGSPSASAGSLSTARKVSSSSYKSSSVVCTETVWLVSPLAKLSVCAVVIAV